MEKLLIESALKGDILQEISDGQLCELRDLYKKNWPKLAYIYYYLDTTIEWKLKHDYPIRLFAPHGDWKDGTVVMIAEHISCYTLEPSNARLTEALRKTKIINWNFVPNFHVIHKNQSPLVLDIMHENGLMPFEYKMASIYGVSVEKALKYEYTVPAGLKLEKLNEKHAEHINSLWPHRSESTIKYITALVKYNNGFGLFLEDGTLVSWILRNDYGSLAILQTEEKHRGKGYAKIVTKALCKDFASKNIAPLAFLIVGNTASEKLFKELGFELIDYLGWYLVKKI